MDFVRKTLEKQLEAKRKSVHASTALSPEAAAKASVLGPKGKPLTLSSLRTPIDVVGISAKTGDLEAVHSFLARR